MGNTNFYYKEMLQKFAYVLCFDKNKKLADKMLKEYSEHELKTTILTQKTIHEPKEYYFLAGRVMEEVLLESDYEGNDAFNACCASADCFVKFVLEL